MAAVVGVFLCVSVSGSGAVGSSSPRQRVEALVRAHPFVFAPSLGGVPGVRATSRVLVSCRRGGYLAGVGSDYRCDIDVVREVETFACVALFRDGAIRCQSESVDCPRYVPPSRRHGLANFTGGDVWSLSYPRRFSLFECAGTGFNTDYNEVGVSNFNARAGYYSNTWPHRDRWPRNGVFMIVGGYAADFLIQPHPDTRFPLSLKSFHSPGLGSRPGISREVWSHGGRYIVQIYLGPTATPRDRAAIKAALHSLRP